MNTNIADIEIAERLCPLLFYSFAAITMKNLVEIPTKLNQITFNLYSNIKLEPLTFMRVSSVIHAKKEE